MSKPDPWKRFLKDLRSHVDARPGLNDHQMEIVIRALLARHPQITRIKSFIGAGEYYACKNHFSHRDNYIYFYYLKVPSSVTGRGVTFNGKD